MLLHEASDWHVLASDRDCQWIRKNCSVLHLLMCRAQQCNVLGSQTWGVLHIRSFRVASGHNSPLGTLTKFITSASNGPSWLQTSQVNSAIRPCISIVSSH